MISFEKPFLILDNSVANILVLPFHVYDLSLN